MRISSLVNFITLLQSVSLFNSGTIRMLKSIGIAIPNQPIRSVYFLQNLSYSISED